MCFFIVAGFFPVTAGIVGHLSTVKTQDTSFGINCQGSLKCDGQPHDTASCLVSYIEGIDSERLYANGEQIACRNNICAFLQNEKEALNGAAIRDVSSSIVQHGCTVCGSVPTSAGNNVADGELTFNYVNNPACGDRLC
ncbi:Kp4-domain-containing protein [Mycena galericulata]|nr:Kp4-domain-containing protein [Mycena galericulata]KAJ7511879.1 Kp4-domain-containing protein [Mycena galericulata]